MNSGGAARKDTDKDIDIDLMELAQKFNETCKEQGWKFFSLQEAYVSDLFVLYWNIKLIYRNTLENNQQTLRRNKNDMILMLFYCFLTLLLILILFNLYQEAGVCDL